MATGYDGDLSLEIFNDQFRARSARQVAIDGQRSLIATLDAVERQEPAQRLSPPRRPLPDRAHPLGVEFIEFAVDEESADELTRLFAALGFVRAGRHLSKNVDWWCQGAINLVINSEREGFAHASYITHGPSVCAIGLRMASAEAAMARASALLAQIFTQPVAPGEMELPAIRGVGGSLIYFTDKISPLARVWDVEFITENAAATGSRRREAGLVHIDHISQSMQYEEMLSWALFYTSIFAMQRTPELDIADPAGLVRSQVVQTADGSVRFALNASQSSRTMSGRFLSEFFGSGVQHIAFASNDIFATAERLHANGLTLLTVPENYYDDLEARLGIFPTLHARLRRPVLLRDRRAAPWL
jgi:4-hydroxyphenylpyruvate dioxygenase